VSTPRYTPVPLAEALTALRAAVAGASYPLDLPSAARASSARDALARQLDDYLLPRLARLDAPLLVVVGGSTGAGKSTLVNSLVEAPVSAAGVLRPTTRAPVLVCHPSDAPWFRRATLLPGLVRTHSAPRARPGEASGTAASPAAVAPESLQVVAAPALAPGLALLDAPDIDSVVDSNRALAVQLLAAADLWLFVTSAARYADAVPWELLTTARDRGTAIALLLDRVPPGAGDEITAHFTDMLAGHGFGGAPLFVVPEITVDGQGLLPGRVVAPLRSWLAELARDAEGRAAVVRQTIAGALASAVQVVTGLAAAADDQVAAASALTSRVRTAYGSALATVEGGVSDGALLRGEVLARWQEFVGTGELFAALQARIGRLRDRLTAAVTGRVGPGRELKAALESSLAALIVGAATDAAESAASAWQSERGGTELLARFRGTADLGRPGDDLAWRAERLVREWQRGVLQLVRTGATGKRATARLAAYAVNATGLLVMIGVFASTAMVPTGVEMAVAGGTTVAAQKVLEALFGDQAIRDLAAKAREDLLIRVRDLLDDEEQRFHDLVAAAGLHEEPAERLRAAADAVSRAAAHAALIPSTLPALATFGRSDPAPEPAPEPGPTALVAEPAAGPVPEPAAEPTATDRAGVPR
jgi:hypothetical protein